MRTRGEEQQFSIREEQMPVVGKGPEIDKSALIIVDMQNDFLHRDGNFSHIAREHPEANIDMPFLIGTIPNVKRLADAFRAAGRPVVYLAHVLKPNYSDAAFPYWRVGIEPTSGNRTHCVEGTWGAQIIDDLKPQEGDHLIVKKGFGGFSNTPPRYGSTQYGRHDLCRFWSDHLRLRVDDHPRWGRIQLPDDPGERCRSRSRSDHARGRTHDNGGIFADVKTADEVIRMLDSIRS
jgi:isochorismate hydrolase